MDNGSYLFDRVCAEEQGQIMQELRQSRNSKCRRKEYKES